MSYEELKNLSSDELTKKLIEMDYLLMQNHSKGHYIKSPWMDGIEESEERKKAENIDIIGLCITGICAYNKLSLPKSNDTLKFIDGVIENLDGYLKSKNIPNYIQEYYYDVLNHKKIEYLNNYILKNGYENEEGYGKGKIYGKSTEVGRAFSEKEAAFASVLILPAMLALIYISVVVIYFVFFYNGG